MKKKILYIDIPFYGINGGDKNRSRYLWNVINKNYRADLLIVTRENLTSNSLDNYPCNGEINVLKRIDTGTAKNNPVYIFSKDSQNEFETLLRKNRYDIVFFRFISSCKLAPVVEKILPNANIIIDVDMLLSRIATTNWERNKTFKNRFFYFAKKKLDKFDEELFKKNYTFLFTNKVEKDYILDEYEIRQNKNFFKVLPNVMISANLDKAIETKEHHILNEKYILFFGTLDSVANKDAINYLHNDIYPQIKSLCQERNIKIIAVGKNATEEQKSFIDETFSIISPVDNINAFINHAMFIILPLRIASGTRTRILEAAALKKTIITTNLGAEGFDFNKDEIIYANDDIDMIFHITHYIRMPEELTEIGKKLFNKATELYQDKVIANRLIDIINGSDRLSVTDTKGEEIKIHTGKKICIVTNRFYPEVGGAETNIYFQARLLAKTNDVTVICPKRIEKPYVEIMDDITVYRLDDFFNKKKKYPNKAAKTLCFDVFNLVFSGRFDIIQVFPAINYNNMLAFIAAKLIGTPIILASFDYLDYASIIKEKGNINPNLLRFHKPNWKHKILLKNFDFIFAISNKEIDFFRKFNKNVAYSPVPILLSEYKGIKMDPREKYGIMKNDFVYLVLGRVCNVKGQDIVLRAFNQITKDIPEAKLVYVGRFDYEPEFYDELQHYIDKNNLREKVTFTGMIERKEVLGWLHHCDIHVVPVRFMNSGAVVVETWISDSTVIQSDVVDPNLVIDGENGYLFPREDFKTCAVKMKKAYENKENLYNMAQKGKKFVLEKYTYDYLINLYLSVYDKLIKKRFKR